MIRAMLLWLPRMLLLAGLALLVFGLFFGIFVRTPVTPRPLVTLPMPSERTLENRQPCILAFSPAGETLVTCFDWENVISLGPPRTIGGPFQVWDIPSGRLRSSHFGPKDVFSPPAMSADGRFILLRSSTMERYGLDTLTGEVFSRGGEPVKGTLRYAWTRPAPARWRVVEQPRMGIDGIPSGNELVFHDSVTGALTAKLEHTGPYLLTPDETRVAVVNKDCVEIWDLPYRRPVGMLLILAAVPALLFTALLWWRLGR